MGSLLVALLVAVAPGFMPGVNWLPLGPGPRPDPGVAEPPAELPGACKALGRGERLAVDLDATPLVDVARLVGCALSRNIVFQPATLGAKTVTMYGARPMSRADLASLWAAVLADAGLVAERHGAYEVVRGR